MPEINQYTVTQQELVELVIKHVGIHEGEWTLLVGIGVGSGNFGVAPDQIAPGVMVTFNQIGIQRVMPGSPQAPGSVNVDAAKVNPKKKKS